MARINLKAELNEPQMQAVTNIEGPVLIIAGAGSGKTRVITYRIAHMLEKGIPQHAILALTFTNKAAREMQTRVRELTGKKLQSLTVSTFHAFGLSILRDDAELLGYRKNFSIYDETDKITLMKESLRDCRMSTKKIDFYSLGQLFSNIKTEIWSWNDSQADPVMRPVYEEYQHGLKVYNALDFDDLLVLPQELFYQQPQVLEKYRNRYRYIMVDEFQDTSLIQYRLMRLLARGAGGITESVWRNTEGVSNICVVGDDDQSIYSWRGANYRNILLFEKDFPGAKEIKLEQNYRSTTTILEAANGVISHNSSRKEKTLWTGKEGGRPIELFFPENEKDEAEFIAAQIKTLMHSDTLRYYDFGVLTRTNSLAGNIEEAFLAEDIPYRVSGGTSFFARKEIKDIISYLRLIANPFDDVSLLRIINTPGRGLGKVTVAALSHIAGRNKTCIWDAISRLNHERRGGQQQLFSDKRALSELEEFSRLIETQRAAILERKGAPGKPWLLSEKVRALVDEIDYWSYLVTEHGKEEKKARWKFGNIEHFIRMIEYWERDGDTMDGGLYAWLNRISLITQDDHRNSEDGKTDALGKVNLMTIHSAKGLEFPVVFIAGAEEGLIPHEKSIDPESGDEGGSIEEERRLFYVAITRAREKLYITSCQKRRYLQSTEERVPSPFLEEIPVHLIQYYQGASAEESEAMVDDIMEKIKKQITRVCL